MDKETMPAAPPVPRVIETWDPRESITWPRGWIDAFGTPRQVTSGHDRELGRLPFREWCEGGLGWIETDEMGPLPHRRVP